jgi:hypothetical protein
MISMLQVVALLAVALVQVELVRRKNRPKTSLD